MCISAERVHLTPGSPFLLVDMAHISVNGHYRFHAIPLPSPGTALYGSTLECSVRSSGTSAILSNPLNSYSYITFPVSILASLQCLVLNICLLKHPTLCLEGGLFSWLDW